MAKDITQIRIGNHDFGIVGLSEAIESVFGQHSGASDDAIAEALFVALSKGNYLPESAKNKYKAAFLKEYRKHQGLPPAGPEEEPEGLVISILGEGCSRCDKLEMDVITLLSKHNIPARVEHIRDVKAIARMGVMGVPALMINGKVKCAGAAPSPAQLLKWVQAAF